MARPVILLLATFIALSTSNPINKIDSNLAKKLEQSTANVLITFNTPTSVALSKLPKSLEQQEHSVRTTTVARKLQELSDFDQKSVRQYLTENGVKFEVFWITNQIYIRNASKSTVSAVSQIDGVKIVEEEFEVKLDPVIQGVNKAKKFAEVEWGISNIGADLVWETGNKGEGVIVGGIDTGVHATHVDLAANFVGASYGWRDVTLFGTETPRDDNGHGTHTMGSIVGANGIGVAPGAKWMACKALNGQGSGTNAGLVSCGQFMACPTLPDGTEEDCSKAPHVVSNSWGGGQANPFYNQVINSWIAAGIIPVFANGNAGPECSTANSPADSLSGVIAVGASTVTNELAYFSSKGPTAGGRMKPDISAPGLDVRSAWHTPGTSAYNTISGTSMATPHVAGVVALMKSANPNLTYAQLQTAIYDNANEDVVETGYNCDSVSESVFPNHAFGHGIIDAVRAVGASGP